MQNILVTGANGGIGSAIVRSFLQAKSYRVIAVVRDKRSLNIESKQLTIEGADLSLYEDIIKLEEKIKERNLKIDWVINAHGFIDTQTNIENQSPEKIYATFNINVLSVIFLTKLFLKHLRPGGGMINISSTAGIDANGRVAAYSASKAALNSFTQGMARNQPDFKFISICPGPTNTTMRERIAGDADKHQSPEVIADIVKAIIEKKNAYSSGDIVTVRDGQQSKMSIR